MEQLNFKTPFEFTVSVKYFTAAWPDSGTQIWVFLYSVSKQEPFLKRRKCNIQNSKILI